MKSESKKPVILIVDDEPEICEILNRLFTKEGYRIYIATNGKEAVEKVSAGGIELVLLDIFMPVQNGIETLRQLKIISPELPVIIMTALASIDTAREAMLYDACDYTIKSFNLDFLKEVIKQALEEHCLNI